MENRLKLEKVYLKLRFDSKFRVSFLLFTFLFLLVASPIGFELSTSLNTVTYLYSSKGYCMRCCLTCQSETKNPKFCSKSCAATFNNKGVRRHGSALPTCKNCKRPTKRTSSIFCSIDCSVEYKNFLKLDQIIKNKQSSWKSIKEHLMDMNRRCTSCNNTQWLGNPIPLECDHIDGDITNNILSNARLLCPNCHSQTSTFRALNAKNPKGQDARRKRYYKSIK